MLIQVSVYVTLTHPKYGDQQTSLAIAQKNKFKSIKILLVALCMLFTLLKESGPKINNIRIWS